VPEPHSGSGLCFFLGQTEIAHGCEAAFFHASDLALSMEPQISSRGVKGRKHHFQMDLRSLTGHYGRKDVQSASADVSRETSSLLPSPLLVVPLKNHRDVHKIASVASLLQGTPIGLWSGLCRKGFP
jgi:hypothetical protein